MTTNIFGDLNTVFGGALRSVSPVADRSLVLGQLLKAEIYM
ncbi:hypothetical protein [Lentilactobacillus sp. TOM.63]|nr:hypothetical protein [Lentilactobacillus sp. TOM.63]